MSKFQQGEIAIYIGDFFVSAGITPGTECLITEGFSEHMVFWQAKTLSRKMFGYIIEFNAFRDIGGRLLFAREKDLRKRPGKPEVTEWSEDLFMPKDLKVKV